MRTKETIRVLGGSIAVYVIMAACAASSGTQPAASKDGGLASGSGSGGSSSGSGSGSDDGPSILDALTDPVSEANAGPTTNTVPCSSTFTSGTVTVTYAEQAYPGMTVVDLSALRVILNYASGTNNGGPPGDTSIVSLPYLRDGFADVVCGESNSITAQSVTFVMP